MLAVGAAAAAVTLSACVQTSSPSGNVRMGEADADAIEVAAVDNAFEPAVVEVEAGEEVTLEIRNDGG
ncbi:MAG: cupredoxin domain-containing protein [Nitriliruptorales bacterium]